MQTYLVYINCDWYLAYFHADIPRIYKLWLISGILSCIHTYKLWLISGILSCRHMYKLWLISGILSSRHINKLWPIYGTLSCWHTYKSCLISGNFHADIHTNRDWYLAYFRADIYIYIYIYISVVLHYYMCFNRDIGVYCKIQPQILLSDWYGKTPYSNSQRQIVTDIWLLQF
jgi:hypothetical protein